MSNETENANPDAKVDEVLINCLSLESPKSFFLFAGAGSGKTHSLIETLKGVREKYGETLRTRNQHIAVITYTRAASEEIQNRLGLDNLFAVSTIHSFLWELIRFFQNDIRDWVKSSLGKEIRELKDKNESARSKTTKVYLQNQAKIEAKEKRLLILPSVKVFSYNPNGENKGRDSLNHSEVIAMGAYFIKDVELMGNILVQRFPILLIDECQDTNKDLMDAFLKLQAENAQSFSLGLFGDMMQRIYFDGKPNLSAVIPANWEKPTKVMNYRSPRRVIKLINQIRHKIDGIEQQAKSGAEEGIIRLFLSSSSTQETQRIERTVVEKMATYCNDPLWKSEDNAVKVLALEHHMAASRMGFLPFYEPLQKVERYRTGLLDGSLSGIGLFLNRILPILQAHRSGDEFGKALAVRSSCLLLDRQKLCAEKKPQVLWDRINAGIIAILDLWKENRDPKMINVLRKVDETQLFEIPSMLKPMLANSDLVVSDSPENKLLEDEENQVWNAALDNPFSMFEKYAEYVSGQARFGTHQGVKGLEFDRVMVVIDDAEAKGFMFSYEKLFGVKEKSSTDIKNENEGNDNSIDRTARLFYVTCSRAKKSLAIIAYSADPERVKQLVLDRNWFLENEIEIME